MIRTRILAASLAVTMLTALGVAGAPATAIAATYTDAQLQTVQATLDRDTTIPGTAWEVDSDAGRVVMSYDDTVTGDRMAQLLAATERFGDAVRLEHLAGTLGPGDSRTVGGNAIFGGSTWCSLGFNTIRSGIYYFITAGHCTRDANYWYDNDHSDILGYRVTTVYGEMGMDYGVVRYTNSRIAKYGEVDLYNGRYQQISTSRWANRDEYVCRAGSRTGVRCGYVSHPCASVTWDDGVKLTCMIKTTACADRGDSGGPLWSGEAALGIWSGGRRGCGMYPNGPTYFTSVERILALHGLRVF